MGLDMYLAKKTYVKNWEHTKPENKHTVIVKKAGKVLKDIKPERVEYIVESIGYWRKANAIHNWFVENVVRSEDWHGDSVYVSREDLKKLLETCEKVLASSELVDGMIVNGQTLKDGEWVNNMEKGKYILNHKVAEELLPTASGFFFGSQEYDEWYYKDIEDTVKIIKEALLEEDNGEFEYSASW